MRQTSEPSTEAPPIKKVLTYQDVVDFEKFMDGFWYEKDLLFGEPKRVRLYDYDAAMKKYGAMGKTGGVFPEIYVEFRDKMEAMKDWHMRRAYAKKKELEQLGQYDAVPAVVPPRPEQAKKDIKPGVVWHPNCIVCGNENPAGMARVCSSKCYLEAPLTKAPAV